MSNLKRELARVTIAAFIIFVALLIFTTNGKAAEAYPPTICDNVELPFITGPLTVKHARANLHQRKMITRILNVGRRLHANRLAMVSSIAATTQEASATNIWGGGGTSVGLFQLIDTWGSVEQRHNPEYSARWYFRRAIPISLRNPGMNPGDLAQAVERSAYPSAYYRWVGEARRSVAQFQRNCA